MAYRIICWTVLMGISGGGAWADSIRIGDVLHENVYVGTSKRFYYVHFPEEGRVEKVSRARREVEAPVIDPDADARERLRARFDERKAEIDREVDAAAEAPAVEVDVDAFLHREAASFFALFDAQREHWRALPAARQQAILDEVLALSEGNAVRRANEQQTIAGRLEGLETARAKRERELERSKSKRDAAVEKVDRQNVSDLYRKIYEEEVVGFQQGNSDYLSDYWIREAATQDAVAARRKAKANRSYTREAADHARVLDRVEDAITQREREAIATANKAHDADRRYRAYLARIDELIGASGAEYEPQVPLASVGSWKGDGNLRTPPFTVESEVWRLVCTRDDFELDGDFKITVVDAETDTPFTAITGKDFLHMRALVVKRPGHYYFLVEQDRHTIPYELSVSAVVAGIDGGR